jgi:hypothetical protein
MRALPSSVMNAGDSKACAEQFDGRWRKAHLILLQSCRANGSFQIGTICKLSARRARPLFGVNVFSFLLR